MFCVPLLAMQGNCNLQIVYKMNLYKICIAVAAQSLCITIFGLNVELVIE